VVAVAIVEGERDRWPLTAVLFCGVALIAPSPPRANERLGLPQPTMVSLSDQRERELSIRQAALVDSAFEEGQYESGIAMLEQLSSPTDHPSR
jgi:hypothetical protein